jgi:hypothetical protein
MGLWLLALAVVNLALQVVENQNWLSMLSVSQEYARAEAPHAAFLQALATTVRCALRWAHYTHILVVVGWMLLFFTVLYRLAVVPRVLAAAGVVTAMMHLGGVTLPVLLDYRVPLREEFYAMPLAVPYLGLALWLMTKGFNEDSPTSDETSPA